MSKSVEDMKKSDVISDPNDVLGLQYNKYKNSLYSDSLSKPSECFKLRGELEEKLKTVLVSNIYKTIYELLRYGQINGASVCGEDNAGKDRIPGGLVQLLTKCHYRSLKHLMILWMKLLLSLCDQII